MGKPFATAEVDGSIFSSYGRIERVEIKRSKACHGRAVAQFYAPGWRPMAFTSVEAAKAKMERHPGFIRWSAAA